MGSETGCAITIGIEFPLIRLHKPPEQENGTAGCLSRWISSRCSNRSAEHCTYPFGLRFSARLPRFNRLLKNPGTVWP